MLIELYIRNFAIIEELRLSFEPGLNILTGETGAGKSIIIDAITALMGGRSRQEWLRTGADSFLVEGVFSLPPHVASEIAPILEREGLEGESPDVLLLSREVRASGRNVARINGRMVSLSLVREVGDHLVDIHGQGEHLSLLHRSRHLLLLDRFAGLEEMRADFSSLARELRQVRDDLSRLRMAERDRARRMDLLEYQVREIESANLVPGEMEELEQERTRLAHAAQLMELMDAAYRLLEVGGEGVPSASDMLSEASGHLSKAASFDPSLEQLQARLDDLLGVLSDLSVEIRDYRDDLEFNPRRLDEVEGRLALLENLQRKYGDTVEEILEYASRAAEELEALSHSEERAGELEERERGLLRRMGEIGARLSDARREAAARLSAAVERELGELNMTGARFSVSIEQREAPDGVYAGDRRLAFDATGLDRVEFLMSANPGEELRPLAKVASGGETARLMMALKAVLSRADPTPVLIFDEIDVGIGGRVGSIVGEKLRSLARNHQVLCVTHLPQVAAYGDRHLKVEKRVADGRTRTIVTPLEGERRVEELAEMLGTPGESGWRSAEGLLTKARETKER
jgi:DNA repair protein RecN (Recombination protein N)